MLLLRKLAKYRVDQDALKWCKSYLMIRATMMQHKQSPFQCKSFKLRVPQGSIIGLSLFGLHVY